MLLYRAMKMAPDGQPQIGASARTLGVRRLDRAPNNDVNVLADDELCRPGDGGMSVAPSDPMNLPRGRRPLEFGGVGLDPVWMIDDSEIGAKLRVRHDHPGHALIEPATAMTAAEFDCELESTRPLWRLVIPRPGATP